VLSTALSILSRAVARRGARRRGRCTAGPRRAWETAMQSSSGEMGGILREFY